MGESYFCYRVRQKIVPVLVCVGVVVVATVLAVVLAAYSVLRRPTITVEEASLTRFSLATTPTTALAYNLSLRLDVRNRNWAMTMTNVEPLEAAYSFDNQQFDRVQVRDKGYRYNAAKTTVVRVDTGSDGAYAALGNAGVTEYGKQKANGTFIVDVKLTGKVKYTARYTKCKIEATCRLELPVVAPPSATPEPGVVFVFQKVPCKFAKPEKHC
jgi:hypothetical protein